MGLDGYSYFAFERDGAVLTATFSNPPVNLLNAEIAAEFDRLSRALAEQDGVVVLILRSADPDFFIAHYDLSGPRAAPAADGTSILDLFMASACASTGCRS